MIKGIANQCARLAFRVVDEMLEEIVYHVAGEKTYDPDVGSVVAEDEDVVNTKAIIYSPSSRERETSAIQPEDMWCEICAASPEITFEPKLTDKVERAGGVYWDIVFIKWEATKSVTVLQIRKGGVNG